MKSKYLMAPPDYYEVIRSPKLNSNTHLNSLGIDGYGDFTQCGVRTKNWEELGVLKNHEVTCKSCLKALRARGIYPNTAEVVLK